MENKKIIVYTSTTCPYCDMAKDYFQTKSIPYEEKSTADPENRKKLVSMGIRGVPAIFIGENYFVGFDPVEIEKLMSEINSENLDVPGEKDDNLKTETLNYEEPKPDPIIEETAKVTPEPMNVQREEKAVVDIPQEKGTESLEEIKNQKEEGKMKKYICQVCGYVYDPADGDEDNGIAPGTSFEDLPEDWVCPLCGVGKDQFEVE